MLDARRENENKQNTLLFERSQVADSPSDNAIVFGDFGIQTSQTLFERRRRLVRYFERRLQHRHRQRRPTARTRLAREPKPEISVQFGAAMRLSLSALARARRELMP